MNESFELHEAQLDVDNPGRDRIAIGHGPHVSSYSAAANSRPNSRGPRAVLRLPRGGRPEQLRHGRREGPQSLGVLEGIPPHVRDDAVAGILDLVEEGSARRHVVDGAGKCVDVRSGIELDGVEDLLGRDVTRPCRRRSGLAASGATRMARTMPKSMTTVARGWARAGSRCFSESNRTPPASGRRSHKLAGLMSRWTRPALCKAASPAARDSSDHLPQLEERHRASPSNTASRSAPMRYSRTRNGTVPETPRSMMLATFGW